MQKRVRALSQALAGLHQLRLDETRSRLRRFVITSARVIFLMSRGDVFRLLNIRAQALTYQSLLALAPLLAVVFAIFKGFGGLAKVEARMRDLIVTNLSGSPEVQAQITGYLDQLVGNIQHGSIGAVSIVILIYSVLALLDQIEHSFNDIFGSKTRRPLVTRFVMYWAVLTLGPLLVGASLALTAAAQSDANVGWLAGLGFLGRLTVAVLPIAVTWLAFTALYWVVPSTRVRLSAAFFAALVAGTAWNIAKWGYAIYAKNAFTMTNVYGSLAAVPLFILWLWLSWLLVLVGAQLAFAYQNAATYHEENEALLASQAARETAACRIMLEVARDFFLGKPATSPETAASAIGVPRRLFEVLAQQLVDGGFLRVAGNEEGLVPARDLEQINVDAILAYLHTGTGSKPRLADDEPNAFLTGLMTELEHDRAKATKKLDFRTLAARFSAPLSQVETDPERPKAATRPHEDVTRSARVGPVDAPTTRGRER